MKWKKTKEEAGKRKIVEVTEKVSDDSRERK